MDGFPHSHKGGHKGTYPPQNSCLDDCLPYVSSSKSPGSLLDTQDTSHGCQADMFCLDAGSPNVSSSKSPGTLCYIQDISVVWEAEIYGHESNEDEDDKRD